jgi:uncharacterized membrane protein YedE/YeeE
MTRLQILEVVSALATGMLFSAGLIVSGMVNPAKVQGFLDLFGRWDPSLALVMALRRRFCSSFPCWPVWGSSN